MSLPKPLTIYRMWLERVTSEPDLTHSRFADEMGIHYSVFMSRWNVGRIEYEEKKLLPGVPGEPEYMEGDAVIVGDVHAPYTDYGLAYLVSQIGKKYLKKPRHLIIAGDLFNQDMFSSYIPTTPVESWATEREAVRGLLTEWLRTFDKITFTMGNHDRRLQKWAMGNLDDTDLLAMVNSSDKITSSNYGYSYIISGGKKWMITHPTEYSINQLIVLSEQALKYQVNVIGFHEHHLAKGWDKFGHYNVVNGGCLVDPDRLAYVKMNTSKRPEMKQGFVLLKNGVAEPLGREPFTDWSRWL